MSVIKISTISNMLILILHVKCDMNWNLPFAQRFKEDGAKRIAAHDNR